jgi:hypothetical protein
MYAPHHGRLGPLTPMRGYVSTVTKQLVVARFVHSQGGNGTRLCGPDPFANVQSSFPACSPPASPAANPTAPPPTSPPSNRSKLPVVLGASVAVVALIAACVGGFFVLRRHGCRGLRPPELPTVGFKGTVSSKPD